ncbi:MAG: hypothetical protein QOC87_760, partial [Actinomycetota bacterium]|nr:hypothetical protein [Actinomycetota bacterium]
EPAADLYEGRLARSVGTQQADKLAGLDVEADAFERARRTEALRYCASLEDRCHAYECKDRPSYTHL